MKAELIHEHGAAKIRINGETVDPATAVPEEAWN